MSQKYLYGASVQGIQSFIFETNKLKEIIGASEMVEQICSKKFFLKELSIDENEEKELEFILSAAGNIKLVTSNEALLKKIVLHFPFMVENFAPGITLSQSIVCYENDLKKKDIDQLEINLKIQRNKEKLPAELSSMATLRSRRTGKVAITYENNEALSSNTKKKIEKSKEANSNLINKISENKNKNKFPLNIESMISDSKSTFIAVIHIDGNNLGKIIQEMSQNLEKNNKNLTEAFSMFSKAIDHSTIQSAKRAFLDIIQDDNEQKSYPIRPLIIGGDDLTVIIHGNLAMKFTTSYLKYFEEETKKNLEDLYQKFDFKDREGLTACAGIAYMKASYPFYYAYELCEELCSYAKKELQRKSGLAFHKITDSFITSYHEIRERELQSKKGISLCNNPYHLEGIQKLQEQASLLAENNEIKSFVKNWLNNLDDNLEDAKNSLERFIGLNSYKQNIIKKLELDKYLNTSFKSTHLFDVISLLSIIKGE